MRTIKRTNQFKRDFKRESAGHHRRTLERDFVTLIQMLASDSVLPPQYRDHPLKGTWAHHRECHLKGDLLLVYRKPDASTLELERMGSHSELGF